jgi:hypothetical protein
VTTIAAVHVYHIEVHQSHHSDLVVVMKDTRVCDVEFRRSLAEVASAPAAGQ